MRVRALVLALLSHIRSGIIVGPKGAVIQPGMTLYYEKDAHADLRWSWESDAASEQSL
jgi:hypothetical protein